MSQMKYVMPRCLGTSGSVRAMRMAQRATWALEVHTFCPLTTQLFLPDGARTERGQVGPGAGLAEELAPDLLADPQRPEEVPLSASAEAEDGRRGHAEADADAPRVVVGRRRRPPVRRHRRPGGRGAPSPPRPSVVHPGESGVEAGLEEVEAVRGRGRVRRQKGPLFFVRVRSSAASVMRLLRSRERAPRRPGRW